MAIKVRKLSQVCEELAGKKEIGFDTETTGKEYKDHICLMQFFVPETGTAYVCPVDTIEYKASAEDIAAFVKYFPQMNVTGHNLQFDLSHVYKEFKVLPKSVVMDTYLTARMLQEKKNGLKDLIVQYHPEFQNAKSFTQTFSEPLPIEAMTQAGWGYKYSIKDAATLAYAGNDPYYAWLLAEEYRSNPLVQRMENIVRLESEFVLVAATWNSNGVRVDLAKYNQVISEMEEELSDKMSRFYQLAGRGVKINSPKDLQNFLYKENSYPVIETTKTGAPSTSIETLERIAEDGDELIKLLVEVKHIDSVYRASKKVPEYLDPGEDTVHPEVQQIGFDGTGRVYVSDPSISQWPLELRAAVIPDEGKKFVYFDLSAAEPTILAHWAGCTPIMEAHKQGKDLHRFIASTILDIDYDSITKKQREVSKVVNLAVSYGSEGAALVRSLQCSEEEAKDIIKKYFTSFPEIRRWIVEMKNKAHQTGWTHTKLGRIRRLPNLNSFENQEVAKAERQVINSAIQASCADYFKIACRKVLDWVDKGVTIKYGVFDSFLLQVPEEWTKEDYLPLLEEMSLVAEDWKFQYKYAEGHSWREVAEKC